MPPTVRSPMVIRKFFAATAGRRNTRYALSFKSYWAAENACAGCFCVSSVRVVLGGLPSSTFSGKSTGLLPNSSSRTCKRPSSVAVPTTANGQRSRSQMARNLSKSSGRMDNTYRSCDSLHQICSGDMPCSSSGTARSSKMAPRPASFTSSGKALDRPPAPTSWMAIIGLLLPSCQQRSMTSCARRSISGLPRCTELKSKSALLLPVSIDEAAPPPKPMSMPLPPSWINSAPSGISCLCVCSA